MNCKAAGKVDFKRLRRAIYKERDQGTLDIVEDNGVEILTDDYTEFRMVNYHMAPPDEDWLIERFLWAPSIKGETAAWSRSLARYLLSIDPNMFICLRRIIVTGDSEDDIDYIASEMVEEDMPDFEPYLGIYWCNQSSVIINTSCIENAAAELIADNPECHLNKANELYVGFVTTLLHEIRHLGLTANPFLSEKQYPVQLQTEESVEAWAIDMFETI